MRPTRRTPHLHLNWNDPSSFLRLVQAHHLGTIRHVQKHQHLFHEGDESHSFYIIIQGIVTAYQTDASGKQRIRRFFSKGDVVGHNTLFHETYIASTQVIQAGSVLVVDIPSFLASANQNPRLLMHLFQIMETTHRNLARHMGDSYSCTHTLVIKYLLRLMHQFGEPHSEGIALSLPLTQDLLAKYAGVTRVTVTRTLQHLVQRQIVSLQPKPWIIHRSDLLQSELEASRAVPPVD
ncbi:Crp/Fnr family transcriptional regulator [Paenibacillus sp. N1-5-1-14]|uniref:Crp/Fnr family transcriptional regulator n=1 Tax=Paenibacillus radicibacter TaxID=2972488 RepID=UPI0021597AF0|nr:Crp/Fnr family transcriptional regulator [Paenibacillus radicibacter]MCR8644619.1 Crp/Fnr family transcriptional regulator [Paenibacillus radicibacter]